jgi:protein O-mannosyl-transferase
VLVVAVLVVYWPLRTAGFVWDDDHLVYASPLVHASDGVARFWLTREAHDYFPLTNTSFWLEWRLWGMDARGYHATNVLLHVGAALLVWRILLHLQLPGAWLVALLFAVHPANVASVAWIAERKNTLSMLLASGAVLCWLRFDDSREGGATRRGGRWWLAAAILFVAALLAKTSVVALPVVLLGCAWWRRGRLDRRDLVATAPLFTVAAVLAVVTILFQYGNVVQSDRGIVVRPEGLLSRIAAAGWCVWFYIGKTLWPAPLAMIHPRWDVVGTRTTHWLPLAALLAVGALCWRLRDRGGRAVLFALGSAIALLAPVLGLFDIYYFRYSLVAEHWLYTASVPILALAVGIGATVAKSFGANGRRAGRIAAALVVVVFAVLAHRRAETFASGVRLFEHDVAVFPASPGSQYNLAIELERLGLRKEARRAYTVAVEADPDYPEAHHNLANLLQQDGDLKRALHHYERASALRPQSALPLHGQGAVLEAAGRRKEAIERYRRALAVDPAAAAPQFALAFALAEEGELGPARAELAAALVKAEGSADGYFTAASFELRWSGPAAARPLLLRALELDPTHAAAQETLATIDAPPAPASADP